jgi:perosamine synthetase
VIIPAYHCRTMVDPARWLGASVVFSRINPDLSLDVANAIDRMGSRTRAMIVPHYFGFPQALRPLLEACRANGVALVEDCAHAFFTSCEGMPAGGTGDYAIASLTKFFPGPDGGAYCANGRDQAPRERTRRRLGAELRAALAALEASAALGGHTTVLRGLAAVNRLRAGFTRAFTGGLPPHQSADGTGAARDDYGLFDPADRARPISLAATWLARASVTSRIAACRRRNYSQLSRELANVAGGRALLPALPEGVVPYVFPYLIDDPARHFAPLKRLGVPIWRWEDIAHSDCEVSLDYRLRLLQLPCHQSLEPADIDRIVQTVRSVLD